MLSVKFACGSHKLQGFWAAVIVIIVVVAAAVESMTVGLTTELLIAKNCSQMLIGLPVSFIESEQRTGVIVSLVTAAGAAGATGALEIAKYFHPLVEDSIYYGFENWCWSWLFF